MKKILKPFNNSLFLLTGLFILFFAGYSSFEGNQYSPTNPQFLSASRTCGTVEFNEMQMKLHPEFRENRKQIEEFTRNYQVSGNRVVITIPVVFHVVYNTQAQNISDAQILSQLEVLNRDFNRSNSDTDQTPAVWKPIAANTQIQFCLAQRDPNGNATSGITRTQTSVTAFNGSSDQRIYFTAQGGHDIWDRDKYLNIYTCNLGGGLLGYAQFPGGNPQTDGTVNLYTAVGTVGNINPPYDKGRTVTHEVGHWLNLYHIWGDEPACAQDDEVADTPLQGNSSSGCPTFPHTDACQPNSPGVMFMNYMDYSNDACMNLFTLGQSVRTSATLAGPRLSLATSNGCVPIGITPISSEIPKEFALKQNYPNPFNPVTNIRFDIVTSSVVTLKVYDIKGNEAAVLVNQNLNAGTYNVDFDGNNFSSGIYFYVITAGEFTQTKKMVLVK
jgi:hypothetical protein